jgi:uncharacterized lipoprotein YajG
MRPIRIVVAALLLSGCASYVWYRPGATPEMLAADRAQCEAEAQVMERNYELGAFPPGWWGLHRPFGPTASGLQIEQDVMQRCMESRGYRLEKEARKSS